MEQDSVTARSWGSYNVFYLGLKWSQQENGIEEMRVQEKASTSCAKMTEERSMNGDVPSGSKKGFGHGNADGVLSPNLSSPADPDRACSIAGGRLKFFKGIIFKHEYNQGKK